MRNDFERWASAWDELEVSAEEFIDAGNRVLVTAYHRGRPGQRCRSRHPLL